MNKFIKAFIALAFIFSTGCSSIRMKYEGDFKTNDGKAGTVTAEKTYPLNGDETICIATAIFLGGYCWYYLVMPTVPQTKQMEADVKISLGETLKSENYTLTTVSNKRLSWDAGDDKIEINYGATKSKFKTKTVTE